MNVSIIIPAFNEEERLPKLLFWLCPVAEVSGYEVLVACDGSTDHTREIAKAWRTKPIGSTERLGKGGGIIKAAKEAQGETIMTMDVDFPHPLLISYYYGYFIGCGADFLIGKRSANESFTRRLASWLFKEYTEALFGSLPDTQSGFKIINRELFLKVADDITIKGYAWDVELCLRLKELGLKIEEMPFDSKSGSKVHVLEDGIKMGSNLLKLWYRRRHQK